MILSVVIPTFQRRALLERTLPTVLGQRFPPDAYEVVVVVDGSTDGTAEWLGTLRAPCELRVLDLPHRGLAAARNAGAKAARGEIVLFLDDDIVCDPRLVAEHAAAHARSEQLVAFGRNDLSPDSPPGVATDWARAAQDAWRRRIADVGPRWPDDATIDANVSVPREALLAAGGYDERFTARENAELGLRLWSRLGPFRYLPNAVGHHLYVNSEPRVVRVDGAANGGDEVLLTRLHPSYRPASGLARLAAGPWWKRLLRRWVAAAPIGVEPLVALASWIARPLRGVPGARAAALALLRLRLGIAFWRAAARAAGSPRRLRAEFGVRLPVLLYHDVGPPQRGEHRELTVSPANFARQMRWLTRHGYRSIRPEDWLAWRDRGVPLPEKPVLITFDDAYANVAVHALPVLADLGLTATVFVITKWIGGRNRWDGREVMSVDDVRRWAARGIAFGSHSGTHPDLRTLASSTLNDEVAGSRRELESVLGSPVRAFAYPYGFFDARVLGEVRGTYEIAFGTEEGLNILAGDPHALRRTMVQPHDRSLAFASRIRFGFDPIEHLRARMRVRTRVRGALRLTARAVRRVAVLPR